MTSTSIVKEKDLYRVMVKIRALRRWAVEVRMDPWALRQGLIIAMAIDTEAARAHGVRAEQLKAFDEKAWEYAQEWMKERRE